MPPKPNIPLPGLGALAPAAEAVIATAEAAADTMAAAVTALTVSTGIALAPFGVPIIFGTLNINPVLTRTVTIFPSTAISPLEAFRSGTSGDDPNA